MEFGAVGREGVPGRKNDTWECRKWRCSGQLEQLQDTHYH